MNPKKILFKARLKDGSGWVFWDIYGGLTGHTGKHKRYERKTQHGVSYYYSVSQICLHIDAETIELSTGFRDKNNKRVFSGDIVKIDMIGLNRGICGEIAMDQGGLRVISAITGDEYSLGSFRSEEVEVVSNI